LTVLLAILGAAAIAPSVAAAQEPEDAEREINVLVIDRKGNRERDDDEPVEGAVITVVDAAGDEVGEVETDDEGRATITLPGEGGEVLNIDPNRNRSVTYNLGARERASTGKIDQLPQKLFDGMAFGLIIAITSVGLSLIFGTTGLVNFSHGEHVTWGAVVAWWMNRDHGINLITAALLAIGIGALTGAIVDRVLWNRLRTRGMSLVAMMIVSIGLSLTARSLIQLAYGGTTQPYGDYNVQAGIDIGPITTAPKKLWVIVIILVVIVAVASMLQFSKIGKAMRAVADNGDLAASSGIDVDRVILFVWAMGGGLAALGGVLLGVSQQVHFEMGFRLLLLMFAGITLGGLGTAYGALVGSFVVGVFIEMSTLFIPTELKNVGALGVLIVVLLFRPQGILGRAERVG
jgi:branched-chain amino acid transport system permease protein